MGLFLSQLVVLPGKQLTAPQVLDGYEAVDRQSSQSESWGSRRVRVIASPTQRWWTIEDEAHEMQDLELIQQMATALAGHLDALVVTAVVHDSDVLWLGLYRSKTPGCQWCNDPGYFSDGPAPDSAPFPSDEWRDLFATRKDFSTWLTWLKNPPAFAEESLRRLGSLLDWGPLASDEPFPSHILVVDRQIGEDAVKQDVAQQLTPTDGKPTLRLTAWAKGFETIVGEPFSVTITLTADHAQAQGMEVVLWGPAVDAGMLRDTRIRIGLPGAHGDQLNVACEEATHAQGRLLSARMPTAVIPHDTSSLSMTSLTRQSIRAMVGGLTQHQVVVFIDGHAGEPGYAPWYVGFRPLENSPAGDVGHEMSATVLPRPWIPARFIGEQAIHDLQNLAVPAALVAVVHLEPTAVDVDERVLNLFSAWWCLVAPQVGGEVERVILPAGKQRYIHESGPVPLKSAERKKLNVHLRTAQVVALTKDAYVAPDCLGIGWRIEREQLDEVGAGMTVQISFWIDCQSLEPNAIAIQQQRMSDLVDGVMGADGGIQAFLSAWRWVPDEVTPYEATIGISSSGPMCRMAAWCRRWLRALPNRALWLGPDLRKQLGTTVIGIDGVRETECGEALRLDGLRNDAGMLSALEQRLGSVVPLAEAHERFHEWYYRDRPKGAAPPQQ